MTTAGSVRLPRCDTSFPWTVSSSGTESRQGLEGSRRYSERGPRRLRPGTGHVDDHRRGTQMYSRPLSLRWKFPSPLPPVRLLEE